MTTVFSNGEKMVQMIEENDPQLHGLDKNMPSTAHLLYNIDYSFMMNETQQLSRLLGFDDSMSKREKSVATTVALVTAAGLIANLCIWM